MPLNRFYHLPPEKRQALVRAARKEFGRVSFAEASINQVVKEAGISRGSFYTYFEDKDDLIHYLLSDFRESLSHQLTYTLDKANGDVFGAFVQLYDGCIHYCQEPGNLPLIRNFLASIRLSGQREFSSLSRLFESPGDYQAFFTRINTNNLNLAAPETLWDILDLLFLITRRAVVCALCQDLPLETQRGRFLSRLRLLQQGMMARGEGENVNISEKGFDK